MNARVLVVMGVSGSGKSTVAGLLAGRLGWDLQEGDDLHPPENVAKMASASRSRTTTGGPGSTGSRRGSPNTPWAGVPA
ncbi:MAG: hypothetical protein JOY78_18570 [Pseudonocardia sp.]|nr:hypothetical protein [Pseudonocardia sp.]